jgi:hypothetical protein
MATRVAAAKVVATNVVDSRVMVSVLAAVKRGDFSARLPATWTGSAGKVASALNDIIESNQRLERELLGPQRSIPSTT